MAGSATRSTLCTRVMASTTTSSPREVARLNVVGETHVLRRVLGIPQQLFRQGMFGIEMEIGEQSLAGANRHVADRADAILVVARPHGDFPWDDSR